MSSTDEAGTAAQVAKRGKGPSASESITSVLLSTDKINISKADPMKVARFLDQSVGTVKKVVPLRDGTLKVVCTPEQAGVLKSVKTFYGNSLRVNHIQKKSVEHPKTIRGIVFGVSEEVSLTDLKENFRVEGGTEITGVFRLNTKSDNKETVVITFLGDELPKKVYYGYRAYRVKLYIPKPTRCYKCQTFGHIAAQCRGREKCSRCGENHKFENCTKKETPSCSNCKGSHSAAYQGCPAYKKAVVVTKVKTTEKLSYAQAVKRVDTPAVKQPTAVVENTTVKQPTVAGKAPSQSIVKEGDSSPQKVEPVALDLAIYNAIIIKIIRLTSHQDFKKLNLAKKMVGVSKLLNSVLKISIDEEEDDVISKK